MAKWRVYGRAINRISGVPVGNTRQEVIDTVTNIMFRGAQNAQQVHVAYERFWNNLNPNSNDVVLVSSIKKVR